MGYTLIEIATPLLLVGGGAFIMHALASAVRTVKHWKKVQP